ncbi:MAG: STAS domain-containing protein [Burkholderiales bacterium]
MKITTTRYGDTVIMVPAGRIDHATFEEFRMALAPHLEHCARGQDRVVLDFSDIEYISSVGLRVLMMASKQVKSRQGVIAVAAMQPVVREIFEISHFNLILETFPNLETALAAVSPAAADLYNAAQGG